MISFNKQNITVLLTGITLGIFILICELMISYVGNDSENSIFYNDSINISYPIVGENKELITMALSLFNFNVKSSVVDINDTSLLSEDVTVKIVAQSQVGKEYITLLALESVGETKKLAVQEGQVINGLLIKRISNKELVVEKNAVEDTIKLFHPKELNLTKTEQNNDTEK